MKIFSLEIIALLLTYESMILLLFVSISLKMIFAGNRTIQHGVCKWGAFTHCSRSGFLEQIQFNSSLPPPQILNSENWFPSPFQWVSMTTLGGGGGFIQAENVKQRCPMIQMALCPWMANGQEVKTES